VLQGHLATSEDLPTPNSPPPPACDFFRGLLDHYQIELFHLNPNSILQITIFIRLCEAFLGIPLNFPLFKHYFFMKYQPSAANRKVIGGVGLQTHPHTGFLDPPMKTSLWDGTGHGPTVRTTNPASHLL
jgi:hypothetical protein